jgi:hypothetical protein
LQCVASSWGVPTDPPEPHPLNTITERGDNGIYAHVRIPMVLSSQVVEEVPFDQWQCCNSLLDMLYMLLLFRGKGPRQRDTTKRIDELSKRVTLSRSRTIVLNTFSQPHIVLLPEK